MRWRTKPYLSLVICLTISKNGTPTTESSQKIPKISGKSFQGTPLGSWYSCFSFLSNLTEKQYISFSSSRSFFLIEFLKTVTLSCFFSECVGMLFDNVWPLIEIQTLYLDLLDLNSGILQSDVEKFVGYLRVGLRNLFRNIFGAAENLILCRNARLFEISS